MNRTRWIIALFGLALGAGQLQAQIPVTETEGLTPSRRLKAETQTQKEAETARKTKPVEGGDVAFPQILADPDNIDLNYRFAQGQIARGEIRGALATLERLLMLNPNMHRVRLLYALVLYRLDNLSESERELLTLSKLSLPPELRAEMKEYLDQIKKRRRRTRLGSNLSLGFDYDTNRNASPSSAGRLVQDRFIKLAGSNQKAQDTALVTIANIWATQDLGTQWGHELFASLTYFRAEQTTQDSLDLTAYSSQFGANFKSGFFTWTPSAGFDHVRLSEDTFLRSDTISTRFGFKHTERLSTAFEIRSTWENYSRTAVVPVAPEREGRKNDFSYSGDYILNKTMKLSGGYAITLKSAAAPYNAFVRHSLHVGHTWLLGRGMFLLSGVTFNIDEYDDRDPLVSQKIRDDLSYRFRLTHGAPLTLIDRRLKDLVFATTYEWYHAESNLNNYAYENNKISGMLTYKWEL